jgi:hypothetical protein
MDEERIELSAKDRERLKVLHEVERRHLRQIDAARRLRLSDRQVRRLQERLDKVGDRGLVHGLRGRPSNHKIPEDRNYLTSRPRPLLLFSLARRNGSRSARLAPRGLPSRPAAPFIEMSGDNTRLG